ncbi:MAG: DUF4364 family protein [Butyrivibrio sp.]|nr:DUF4364 family protein [Butyrivibrio sp.]
MSSQYLTLYKMIVLYMLERCEVPLSKSQIYDFILEKEYTNFITLQEVFSELVSSGLITETAEANRTFLEPTKEGSEALRLFENRINPSIRQEIDEHLRNNEIKLRDESSIRGNYKRTGENEYTTHLVASENGRVLVDIKIPVPTEDIAQNILDKWQSRNLDIYKYLMNTLMSE